MSSTFTVRLAQAAHEMAQEEIGKKVAHLSRDIRNLRFEDGGAALVFDAPADAGESLAPKVEQMAKLVQRSLRSLQRKVVFRSRRMDDPVMRGTGSAPGVHLVGTGQAALTGLPNALYRYFDRVFEEMGAPWEPEPVRTPVLIPTRVLARCDYFRSFPHNVTFATHLHEDADQIEAFRARHQERETLDERALADMETPEACLSPAVCYHVYHLCEGQTVPAAGAAYSVCGPCFRYESTNMRDLRRLWDFTMREIVLLGGRDEVLQEREKGLGIVSAFLEEHEMAGEIRTASDPFFIAPDAPARTYFQLSAETKFEISLLLPGDDRLAVGSLNYHTDFFGRAFDVSVQGAGAMHSVCIAFGLERWVCAFLAQHGNDPAGWPKVVRESPEVRRALR